MPHRLGRTKFFEEVYAGNLGQAAGVVLRRATDSVQIDRAKVLERSKRLLAHAALAHHGANAKAFDNVGLIRFLADARGGPSGVRPPTPRTLLEHHRAAVVKDGTS